jgi:hypothetical protein
VLRNPIPKGMGKHRQNREAQIMAQKIYKVMCSKGHVVEVSQEGSSQFEFCGFKESYCEGVVIMVSEQISI